MYPLPFSALSFMCGIAAGGLLGLPTGGTLLSAAVFCAASALLFKNKKYYAAFFAAMFSVFSIGAAVIGFRYDKFATESLLVDPAHYGKYAEVEGLISESPSFSSFTLSADRILVGGELHEFRCRAGVINLTDFRGYDYGDYVRVRGVLGGNRSPGSGYAFMLGVYSPEWITNLGRGSVNPLKHFAISAGKRFEKIIDETMPEPESLFLKSALLGKRHVLPREIRDTLTEIGAGHFLSVSGLHAGLVLAFLMLLAGVAGFTRKGAAVFCIFGLALFTLMTGARVPTVRAVILAVVALSGNLLERRVERWSALSLAAVLILAFKPEELFSPGFRLSFAAVGGIFYLYPAFADLWPSRGRLSIIRSSVLALISVHLAVMPLIGFGFGHVPVVSLPANLILIPVLSLVVALGLAAGLAGLVHGFPAGVIGAANWALIRAALSAAGVIRRCAVTVPFGRVPGFFACFYYAGLLALPLALKKVFSSAQEAGHAE